MIKRGAAVGNFFTPSAGSRLFYFQRKSVSSFFRPLSRLSTKSLSRFKAKPSGPFTFSSRPQSLLSRQCLNQNSMIWSAFFPGLFVIHDLALFFIHFFFALRLSPTFYDGNESFSFISRWRCCVCNASLQPRGANFFCSEILIYGEGGEKARYPALYAKGCTCATVVAPLSTRPYLQ